MENDGENRIRFAYLLHDFITEILTTLIFRLMEQRQIVN